MKHFLLSLVALTVMGSQCAVGQNQVKRLSAETVKLDVSKMTDAGQTVRLSRYLFAGYNTLCLPMSVSAEQLTQAVPGIKVEKLAGIGQEGSKLCLYFTECTSEGIEAGMPYLVFSPTAKHLNVTNDGATRICADATIVRMSDAMGNQLTFSSSWEARSLDGFYGIPAQQNVEVLESVLIRTTANQRFLPTRCGFNWETRSATATTLEIRHIRNKSEVTGLQSLTADKADIVDVYDLNGIALLKQVKLAEAKTLLPAGIYIIGGEKVTFK